MTTKTKHREYSSSEITKHALLLLTLKGYKVWRNNNIAVKGRKFIGERGASDILGISKEGKFIACEVKKKGDVLSEDQTNFLNEVEKRKGIALMAVQRAAEMVIISWRTGEYI